MEAERSYSRADLGRKRSNLDITETAATTAKDTFERIKAREAELRRCVIVINAPDLVFAGSSESLLLLISDLHAE